MRPMHQDKRYAQDALILPLPLREGVGGGVPHAQRWYPPLPLPPPARGGGELLCRDLRGVGAT